MSSERKPMFKLKDVISEAIWDDKKYLLGRVLTIIDASIADPIQRKAMKDIIQDVFYEGTGRRWMILEVLSQFQDKFVKDNAIFQTKDEKDEFLEGKERTTPQGERFAEDYFPNN